MHDSPTAEDLLTAVADFLAGEVASSLPSERRFQALVAANACRIVARELPRASTDAAADRRLFAQLLDASPDSEGAEADYELARRLAREIRAGSFDERLIQTAAALREHVQRKISVSAPGYATGSDG